MKIFKLIIKILCITLLVVVVAYVVYTVRGLA